MKEKCLVLILLLSFRLVAMAQDPYFSQYFSSPLTFNPALTGYIDGSHRLAVNYRSQWANISTPYHTAAVSFDTRIMRSHLPERDKWGLGVHALYDQAAVIKTIISAYQPASTKDWMMMDCRH